MSEDLDRDDWTVEGLLDAHREAWAEELHTALPGRVERYVAAEQVADVTPLVRRVLRRNDGTRVTEAMPTIRAVPIVWPRAGDWFVHMPLSAGDTVLLVCCERDLARWRTTGTLSDPVDTRAHHLAHAVAIPGVYPRTRQLSDTPTDALVIGRDGGSTVRVLQNGEVHAGGSFELTRAGNLDQHLTAIAADLTAIATAAGTTATNYGTPAKEALDVAAPIATTKTKGE